MLLSIQISDSVLYAHGALYSSGTNKYPKFTLTTSKIVLKVSHPQKVASRTGVSIFEGQVGTIGVLSPRA